MLSRTLFRLFAALGLLASFLIPLTASAHEGVTVGKYELEVGWVVEPVLLDETNAVFLSVVNSDTKEPVEGLTTLKVTVTTGGQSRDLELRPLGEDAPGQYAADFIPTVRGQYTVKLSGQIEEQTVDLSVDIEEVELADAYQFPITLPSVAELSRDLTNIQAQNESLRNSIALNQLLATGGMIFGAAGLALGVINLRRKSK
jgi:hypothetical protein